MHEPLLEERLRTLEAIEATARDALAAIADRDLDRMHEIGAHREHLFAALRTADRALATCDRPVGGTPAGRSLRARADAVLGRLVPTEETLRAALARWRDETGDELRGMRRTRSARRAYAAAGPER